MIVKQEVALSHMILNQYESIPLWPNRAETKAHASQAGAVTSGGRSLTSGVVLSANLKRKISISSYEHRVSDDDEDDVDDEEEPKRLTYWSALQRRTTSRFFDKVRRPKKDGSVLSGCLLQLVLPSICRMSDQSQYPKWKNKRKLPVSGFGQQNQGNRN